MCNIFFWNLFTKGSILFISYTQLQEHNIASPPTLSSTATHPPSFVFHLIFTMYVIVNILYNLKLNLPLN